MNESKRNCDFQVPASTGPQKSSTVHSIK
uniref:Uncharacterized protein n=1 Tax=Anguilla anguilla TaxID=7936 RepID=A0A0E9REE8_ANGAN